MRLRKIKLKSDFRSLKSGFELHFLDGIPKFQELNPYCIVGRNGSGKSNILELLSSIFYSLELRCLNYLPEIFEYIDTKIQSPNAYELEYFINNCHIKIDKEVNEYAKLYFDGVEFNSKEHLKEVLPHYVIGYSSGENEILSLPFFKMRFIQFDEYLNSLTNDISYSTPEARLVYLDNEYSQAIFLCNFLFQNDDILKVFKDELKIEKIKSFRIIIHQNHFESMSEEYQSSVADIDKRELTNGLFTKIENLKKCATTYYIDEQTQRLILDFYIDDAVKKAFKRHFYSALELFEFFGMLTLLNLYQTDKERREKIYQSTSLYVKGRLATLAWEDRVFRFKNFVIQKTNHQILSKELSDGEHQFLHTIGIALLYKNTPSLFLLDEPETHFNPDWRAKYISVLKKCFEDDKQTPEVLISSHSPFIVSDTKEDNVLIFEKDENGKVDCKKADFNTFGASVNKITMKVFGKKETIGDVAKDKLTEYKKRLDADEDIDTIIHDIDLELGESVEKILFMKMLFDKQEAR